MTIDQSPNLSASPLAGCMQVQQVDREARSGVASLCCPPSFPGFAGHFPEAPVLPAVMQLLAVRLLAESIVAVGLVPVAGERLKFKGMVQPDERVALRVSLKERVGQLAAEFSLDREGAPIASGTLLFRNPGGEG